jgi:hypothetical protein
VVDGGDPPCHRREPGRDPLGADAQRKLPEPVWPEALAEVARAVGQRVRHRHPASARELLDRDPAAIGPRRGLADERDVPSEQQVRVQHPRAQA